MNDSELLTALVAQTTGQLRVGADPVVVLYFWKRLDLDDRTFAAGVKQSAASGWVEIRQQGDIVIRLTAEGLAHLLEHSELTDRKAVFGDVPTEPAQKPAAGRLHDIFRVLSTPARRPVPASALQRIWALERYRADELRDALDTLLDQLDVVRIADRPVFAMTKPGDTLQDLTR